MGNTDNKPVVLDTTFTTGRFCNPCISMFGTVEALKALGSKKGYRYHSKLAMLAGARNDCPLCKVLYPVWYPMRHEGEDQGDEKDAEKDCIVRAVCARKSHPSIQSKVKGYPLSILSIGFVFSNVGLDERFLTIYQLPSKPSQNTLGNS